MVVTSGNNMSPLSQYFELPWQMTNCEKFALESLLRNHSPEIALEVGTYHGGSLQVLARYSRSVISIDIDEGVQSRIGGKFSNVVFHTGDSTNLLPSILAQCTSAGKGVEFVIIDGDHSAAGVQRDIDAFLRWQPLRRCLVLMHDSFNPACREGIRTAPWASSLYVQSVELDFIPGIYHQEAFDTAGPRTMWGGFALAILSPEKRLGPLNIQASQQGLFDAVLKVSSHAPPTSLRSRIARLFDMFMVNKQ